MPAVGYGECVMAGEAHFTVMQHTGSVDPPSLLHGMIEAELKRLIGRLGRSDLVADEIDSTEPLLRDGLGLDSIDVLDLQGLIAEWFEIDVAVPDEKLGEVFFSVRTAAQHLVELGVTPQGPARA